jgi:HK97 gp10 family phage protein
MAKYASRAQLYGAKKAGSAIEGDLIGALDRFESELREKALRPAAFAGAKMMRDEVKMRVPKKTGKLHDAIFMFFDNAQSSETVKTYLVGPNKRKAPHWYVVEYGHFLYNRYAAGRWLRSKSKPSARGTPGTMDVHDLPGRRESPKWVPPKPYLRPSYDGKIRACLEAMKARLAEKVKEIAQSRN